MNADTTLGSQQDDPEDDLKLGDLEEIDRVCSQFEENLKSKSPHRVTEDFLKGRTGICRGVLLRELLSVELEYRRRKGGSPSKQAYLQRFPNDADCVHSVFGRLCGAETVLTFRASQTPVATDDQVSGLVEDVGDCQLNSLLTQLIDVLGDENVERLRERLGGDNPEERTMVVEELLANGQLTPWQADVLLQGEGDDQLILDEYLLLEVIGSGGMGRVFRARHLRMDREVAIKVLRTSVISGRHGRNHFLREVRAAAKLTHPNIVQAFDAREERGIPFLVMELIEGRTVSSLVREEGVLPTDRAVRLTIQAARALECAHEAGIVHRDVKPGNLMVDQEDRVKLLDLGLVCLVGASREAAAGDESVEPADVAGTVAYMAPEQFDPQNAVDGRADVFGLGATLYFMLTGATVRSQSVEFPLSSSAQRDAGAEISIDNMCDDVTPKLYAILQRMTAVSPEDRFQNMPEVIEALGAIVQNRGTDMARRSNPAFGMMHLKRLQDDRSGPRVGLPLVMTATTAAVVLTAGLFMMSGHEGQEASRERRQSEIVGADENAILLQGGASDEAFATWLLSPEVEGLVVLERDRYRAVTRLEDLPAPPYRVIGAGLQRFDEPLLIDACERFRAEKLTQFYSGNEMTNAALKHIAGIPTLEYLWIDYCKVDDHGLAEIARLSNLRGIGLSGLAISGKGISNLTGLRKLNEINLSGSFTADDLRPLLEMPQIDWLGLTESPVDESIAEIVLGLPNLARLNLSESQIADGVLLRLSDHAELKRVFLIDAIVESQALEQFRRRRPDIICDTN